MALWNILTALALAGPAAQLPSIAQRAQCHEWHECRQLALDAFSRGDYEQFHDFAWRTVQIGPRRDPDLMYLLARAQSLSGRAHDALVMLGRVAEMGIAGDALANDEFRAVRALRDWPQVEALIVAGARPAPVAGSIPPSPPPAIASAPVPERASATPRRTAEDALRLPSVTWSTTGLAYDRVSARFVLADRHGRKLLSIDERSHHLVDFARAESAGFYEVTAIDIDERRGDLWVVSANESGTEGQPATVLHKLQLVSGRPRAAWPLPEQFGAARFDDVAATAGGTVFVLDGIGRRIFRLTPDGRSFAVAGALQFDHPTSLAPVNDHVVYVAHSEGVVRMDVSRGTATPLGGPKNIRLAGFERFRWDRNSLIGIQRLADGTRRAVSVRLAGTGRRPRAVAFDVLEANVTLTDPAAAALSDHVFYFVARDPHGNGREAEIIVRRTRLR